MTERDWSDTGARFLAYVLAPRDGAPGPLFVVLNAASEPVRFTIPEWPGCARWRLELTTQPQAGMQQGAPIRPLAQATAPARSVTVFCGSA